jgi:hypothetical protein
MCVGLAVFIFLLTFWTHEEPPVIFVGVGRRKEVTGPCLGDRRDGSMIDPD